MRSLNPSSALLSFLSEMACFLGCLQPRVYTSIGDYLTHKGVLAEAQRRTAAEEQHRQEK